MKRFLPALLALAAPLALGAAELADAPPIDTDALLREIPALRQKVEESATQSRDNAVRLILQGAASESAAVDLYKNAMKAVQFEGRGKGGAEFSEWRNRGHSEDRLKSKEFAAAAQFHLRYLAIVIQFAKEKDLSLRLEPLMTYAKDIIAHDESLRYSFLTPPRRNDPNAPNALLHQPLGQSIFVEWLDLASILPRDDTWELVPGNVESIYERSILPALRAAKNPVLLQYWDFRIALEEKKLKEANAAFATDKFQRRTRPQYLWNKAEDKLVLGLRNSALRDMFDIIRTNIDHPRSASWMARIEAVIKGETQPATPPSP